MAYPTISSPYGLKPVNLQGGRVYAGSTRMFPISNNFSTALYNGDVVGNAVGVLAATGYTVGAPSAGAGKGIGIFVGAEYSTTGGPIYGKNRYQYYAGSIASNDIVGYVVDDPLAYFRTAVIAQGTTLSNSATTVGYLNPSYVGSNVYLVSGATGQSTATGDSLMGVSGAVVSSGTSGAGAPLTSTATPFRVIQVVPDTAYTYQTSSTGSASSSTSVTLSASDSNIKPGMQLIATNANGTYVSGCAPGNYLTVTNVNGTAMTVSASVTLTSAATLTFVGYPEVIVGWGAGMHAYNVANGS